MQHACYLLSVLLFCFLSTKPQRTIKFSSGIPVKLDLLRDSCQTAFNKKLYIPGQLSCRYCLPKNLLLFVLLYLVSKGLHTIMKTALKPCAGKNYRFQHCHSHILSCRHFASWNLLSTNPIKQYLSQKLFFFLLKAIFAQFCWVLKWHIMSTFYWCYNNDSGLSGYTDNLVKS